MQNNRKEIEVNGKHYTLTVRRSILFRIANIAPELLKIYDNSKKKDGLGDEANSASQEDEMMSLEATAGEKLYDNMNLIFYEMLKENHSDISLEKSNEIYYNFCNEYNDVDEHLFKLIETVFTQGIPRDKKKNLNW